MSSNSVTPKASRRLRVTAALFSYEPFKTRKAAFNVRAIDLPSETFPAAAEFNIFGLARYLLTYNNRALRSAIAAAPYEGRGAQRAPMTAGRTLCAPTSYS